MSHVLMSTSAAHGHVYPNLPVMAELVARGHRVTYPVPDRFADAVAATGATVLPITTDLADPARGEQWPESGIEVMRLFSDEARSAYAQTTSALGPDLPDVVCYDGSGWAGHALSRVHALPRVELAPHMVASLAEVGVAMTNKEFLGAPDRSILLIPEVMQPHRGPGGSGPVHLRGPGARRPH